MNSLINTLTKLGLLKDDLDYHLIRASMVIVFLFFGYQKWFEYEAERLLPYISNALSATNRRRIIMLKHSTVLILSLFMVSADALADDTLPVSDPLPPGLFTSSNQSDDWKIKNALSAAPEVIAEKATVIDWPKDMFKSGKEMGRILRKGSNGWTCMPDVPGRPQHDPMCADETMMKWLTATLAGKKPDIDRVGLSYMLLGEARQGQGATPAKDPGRSKNGSMSAHTSWSCFRIQRRTHSGASTRISPITSPIYRSSAPQMSRRQSGSFPLQRAATGSRRRQRNRAWLLRGTHPRPWPVSAELGPGA